MERQPGFSRRTFLKASGAAATAAAVGGALGPLASRALAGNGVLIPPGKRGIILFTVRDRIAAAPDTSGLPYGFDRVFARLAEIGYRKVEFAGYNQNTAILGRQITAAEIAAALSANGLSAVGSHDNVPGVLTDATIAAFRSDCESAATIGMPFIGTGGDPTGSNFKADWDAAADRWNTLGAIAAEYGLKLYTHNHDAAYQFLLDSGPLDGLGRPTRSSGIRKLEYFLTVTDPTLVYLEMDVYWAHVAQHRFRTYTDPDGVVQTKVFDPGALAAANATRYPLFHAKDGARTADPPGLGAGYTMVPFGTGDIDYETFFSAIQPKGYRHPIYEQDNAPGGSANPGQSLAFSATSYANMAALRG